MAPTPQKDDVSESIMDDMTVKDASVLQIDISVADDVSAMGVSNNGNSDVMAAFGGFLDKRKRDKGMQRNTDMSQIDGMVNNLDSDIANMMMLSARKKRGIKKDDEGD